MLRSAQAVCDDRLTRPRGRDQDGDDAGRRVRCGRRQPVVRRGPAVRARSAPCAKPSSTASARRRPTTWRRSRPPSPSAGSCPAAIVAILGKTEGNGCVNDFSRGLATAALRRLLERHLPGRQVDQRSPSSCRAAPRAGWRRTGSCSRRGAARDGVGPALAVGGPARPARAGEIGRTARSRPWPRRSGPRWRRPGSPPGRRPLRPDEVPAAHEGADRGAQGRGHDVATQDTYKSMGLSRGASALGVALALGEINRAALGGRGRQGPGRLVRRRLHLGRDRARGQRDRRARDEPALGRRPLRSATR